MAWKMLPTDYTDRTWDGLQKYTEIDNGDGTVSFRDVTNYTSKEKSFFGAYDANRMNEALNILMSMVENGTNLYEDFLEYFNTQKQAFKAAADADLAEYNYKLDENIDTANINLTDFLEYMQAREDEADALMATFRLYVEDFKRQYENVIEEVERDYEDDIDTYKRAQQTLFDVWFQYMRDQLSEDAAGHLQNEIDDLKGSLIKIDVSVQDFLIGKILTCTDGTVTKSMTVDESCECLFTFENPGIYTVTDNFSGMSQKIKAYHLGLYPTTIKVALITVNCPLSMVGKRISLRYMSEVETMTATLSETTDRALSYVGNYTQQIEGTQYSRIVGSDGKAVFAVTRMGTWRVSNNYTAETALVDVEDYKEYTVNLHVANLTVTFDPVFAGNACTISSSNGTYQQLIPETGIVEFVIPRFNEWKITNSRTFDTETVIIDDYREYSASFGVAIAKITFLKDTYIGATVTAKYKTYTVTATVGEDKTVEMELKGLVEWKITNTWNGLVIYIDADEYTTYEYDVDDFVYVNGCVGQFVNK